MNQPIHYAHVCYNWNRQMSSNLFPTTAKSCGGIQLQFTRPPDRHQNKWQINKIWLCLTNRVMIVIAHRFNVRMSACCERRRGQSALVVLIATAQTGEWVARRLLHSGLFAIVRGSTARGYRGVIIEARALMSGCIFILPECRVSKKLIQLLTFWTMKIKEVQKGNFGLLQTL